MKEDSWERRYFAASNSGTGFVNYFPRIFGGGACRRLFVVKGGPGTGKSSFMKRMGEMLVWISGLLLIGTYIAVLLDKVRFYDSWILWASVEVFICLGLLVLFVLERNNLNKKNLL